MGRLDTAFLAGRTPILPFLTVGDPDRGATAELAIALGAAGACAIELGIPYSDPVADGPVIQAASERSLARGTRLADVFNVVRAVRRQSQVPLILFTYANPVYRYGLERFMHEAADAGADGVLMPDLPPEEAGELRVAAARHGLSTVFLVAPTTRPERIAKIVAASTGFVYVVAAMGVTGTRTALADELAAQVARVKACTELPVAVGFGVSAPEHVAHLAAMGADAAIVGSALVERIAGWATEPDLVARAAQFVRSLAPEA